MECALATHLHIALKQAFVYLLHTHEIYRFYDFSSLKITATIYLSLNQIV